jgi:hypothetical protein
VDANAHGVTGYTQDLEKEAHLARPPKSAEPIGCPDHPIQEMVYNLRKFSDISDDYEKP